MKTSRSIFFAAVASVALLAAATVGGEPRTGAEFAQSFYDWYGPIAHGDRWSGPPAWDAVIKSRAADFKPELLRSLAAARGFTMPCDVQIPPDFDPFLGSDSQAGRYLVGEVTLAGGVYRAQVHAFEFGRPSEKTAVVAIFEWRDKRFRFVDFEYPGLRTDLVATMKERREACRKARE